MFTHLNPGDSGNPAVTDMIGTNYAGLLASGPPYPVDFTRCQMAANAWAASSTTNKILAGAASITQSGTWTADTTYANANGLVSTTNGSCLTQTVYVPNGVLYEWQKLEDTSGGTHVVSIDGTPAVDTITGSSTINSQGPYIAATYSYPAMARYVVSIGSHTVASCVTSATGSGNDVTIYGYGYPPQQLTGGIYGARVFIGGVIHFQDDPTDASNPGLAIANAINLQVATQLAADGLAVAFVDVRKYVDSHLGMLSAPAQNCNASASPGLHVNNCGTLELAQAFADTMNLVSYPVATNPNIVGPLIVSLPVAATSLADFHLLKPHSFSDSLLAGPNFCDAVNCGVKMFNSGGFGFGPWINSALPIKIGFLTGGGTSEADWNWPFSFFYNSGTPYADFPQLSLNGGAKVSSFNVFSPTGFSVQNCSGACAITGNQGTWKINLNANSTLDLSGIGWGAGGVAGSLEVCEDVTGGWTFSQGADLWDNWPAGFMSALAGAGPGVCSSFTFTKRAGGTVYTATSGSFLGLAPSNSPALTGTPTTPTASPGTGGTQIASQAYADASSIAAVVAARLVGTTASIGGSLLTAGTCATGTVSVTGAVVGHPVGVSASDGTLPDPLADLRASVTSSATVTVQVCAIAAVTPAAKTYNVITQ